ncbi:Putative flavonol synthase [Hypoxylon texense]
MAETAVGVIGLALAFKGAVDTALFIGSFFDEGKREYSSIALLYHIQKTKLQLWGDECRATDPDGGILRDMPEFVKETVVRILGEIEKLNREVNAIVSKHGLVISPTSTVMTDLDKNLHPDSDLAKEIANRPREKKLRSVVQWVIKTRSDFKDKVNDIRILITELHGITLRPREIQLLANGLEGRVLAQISREDLLMILAELNTESNKSLALSARAKVLQSRISLDPNGSVTHISQQQLRRIGNSGDVFWFIGGHQSEQPLPVCVQWNNIPAGPDTPEYISRINSLGYILERVSEPALRLPPCYGVVDGRAHGGDFGERRLGYVFGIPRDTSIFGSQKDVYDSDLASSPPSSLRDQISQKTSPPLLGDRFKLAYVLACAFSRFHAAGWLHKGFHSGSIIFFQRRAGQRVDVTEPFITGFQYSRPQTATSLPFEITKHKSLQHYYHPDYRPNTDRFTKRFDLYSLGVVLFEIGRWGLLTDRRPPFVNQIQSREYLLSKGLGDLGWRMGAVYQSVVETLLTCRLPDDSVDHEYFVKQYMDKIMRPLSTCNA